jgi:hypothetical protein
MVAMGAWPAYLVYNHFRVLLWVTSTALGSNPSRGSSGWLAADASGRRGGWLEQVADTGSISSK